MIEWPLADASFAVHDKVKSNNEAVMTLGKGTMEQYNLSLANRRSILAVLQRPS